MRPGALIATVHPEMEARSETRSSHRDGPSRAMRPGAPTKRAIVANGTRDNNVAGHRTSVANPAPRHRVNRSSLLRLGACKMRQPCEAGTSSLSPHLCS
jgi:hypothetical protein